MRHSQCVICRQPNKTGITGTIPRFMPANVFFQRFKRDIPRATNPPATMRPPPAIAAPFNASADFNLKKVFTQARLNSIAHT